jgi:diguanylate cyclase (GGDEF)-like protein
MTFRVITTHGRRPSVEATANVQLDDPVIDGFVVYVRPWTERWLLDRAFESVAAGDPIDRTMDLLVEVAGADTMEADASIVFDPVDDAFEHVVACATLPAELQGPVRSLEPRAMAAWSDLLTARAGFVANVEELPSALRLSAESLGHRSLWASPAEPGPDGRPGVWAIAWRRAPHLDADETRTGMVAHLATLAGLALARSRNEERNAYAASHDAMTGLWNRNAVYGWLASGLRSGSGAVTGVGVIYVDLDRFKPINDEFGHGVGDQVLVAVAEALLGETRTIDGRYRWGGDEFALILPGSRRGPAKMICRRVAEQLERSSPVPDGRPIRVSAGVAEFDGHSTVEAVLEAADAELFEIKRTRHASGVA